MNRHQLLLAAEAFAVAAALLALAPVQLAWLRILFGVPLAVLLPGLPIALAPSAALERLGNAGRIAVAVGASITIDMCAGLALASLGVALTPTSTVLALAVISVFGSAGLALHLVLTHREEEPARPAPVLAAAAALGAFAILVALLGSANFLQPTYGTIVQLWALPGRTAPDGTISVGVRNVVSSRRAYRLHVSQGGASLLDARVDLPQGASRTFLVDPSSATTEPVVAVLSGVSTDTPLRTVKVWVVR